MWKGGGKTREIRSKDKSDAIGEFIDRLSVLKNSGQWIGLTDQHQKDWRWVGSRA